MTFKKPLAYFALASSLSGSGSTTYSSVMIGTTRLTIGRRTSLPFSAAARGSAGFIATAVSPSIVSGRVVATVTHSIFSPSIVTGSTSG